MFGFFDSDKKAELESTRYIYQAGSKDIEARAIGGICEVMNELDADAQIRVLKYLQIRYGVKEQDNDS